MSRKLDPEGASVGRCLKKAEFCWPPRVAPAGLGAATCPCWRLAPQGGSCGQSLKSCVWREMSPALSEAEGGNPICTREEASLRSFPRHPAQAAAHRGAAPPVFIQVRQVATGLGVGDDSGSCRCLVRRLAHSAQGAEVSVPTGSQRPDSTLRPKSRSSVEVGLVGR